METVKPLPEFARCTRHTSYVDINSDRQLQVSRRGESRRGERRRRWETNEGEEDRGKGRWRGREKERKREGVVEKGETSAS